MAFGSFFVKQSPSVKKDRKNGENVLEKGMVEEKSEKIEESSWKKSEKEETTDGKTAVADTAACVLSILLIGSSGREIRDFLCSMNISVNGMAGGEGLAFFTKDFRTISDMVAAKKQLDGYFAAPGEGERRLLEEDGEAGRRYVFDISQAGRQKRCVEMQITCCTAEELDTARTDAAAWDAVWILMPQPYLEEGRVDARIFQWLEQWEENQGEGAPSVQFLISQFEYLERFHVRGTEVSLSEKTREHLLRSCIESVQSGMDAAAGKGEAEKRWKLLPVQVYGGLEFAGWTEEGEARYTVGGSGFFQRYVPVGCQMPLMETLNDCFDRGKLGFFLEEEGEELWSGIRHMFEPWRRNCALTAVRMRKKEEGQGNERKI